MKNFNKRIAELPETDMLPSSAEIGDQQGEFRVNIFTMPRALYGRLRLGYGVATAGSEDE